MFKKFIDKKIENRLKQEGFTKVPSGWLQDFEDITEKHRDIVSTLHIVATEYNALLADFVKTAPVTVLKEGLKATGIQKLSRDKAEIDALYIDTFKINFDSEATEVFTDDKPIAELEKEPKIEEELVIKKKTKEIVEKKTENKKAKPKPKTTQKK